MGRLGRTNCKVQPNVRRPEGDSSVFSDQPQGTPFFYVRLQQVESTEVESTERELSRFLRQ